MSAQTEHVVPLSRQKSKDWMGVTAIVLALANIPLFAIDFDRLGVVWLGPILIAGLSLGAVVLGRRGLRAHTNGEASHRLPAVFGLVLGVLGLAFAALGVLFLAFLFVVLASAGA